MEGLAQNLAGAPSAQGMPRVEEVIALLLEGANPEELAQMGIPPELIMQAIDMIEQQMSAQGQPMGAGLPPQTSPAQEPGLAQSMGVR